MGIIDVVPGPRVLCFPVGQACAWEGADGLTVVDPGTAGYAAGIAAPGPVARIVLTHFHHDHTGSAAEPRALTGAPVVARVLEAPVVRGDAPAPRP
ncbi:MBL fold metallo-hydrolase [Saccharothrix syringae]|uniref:MBL fold metallo-hydrolase n=1 Tax=Saccharothrix syringae TaxID=103733 RepID=A0A5Q0H0F4_SACSY|nr:MBL fold metallo-hydrolase [Saccharothrix syringae]QFZ19250.1 MBL fold metallo-hydrolase [Saccharothrix syringae]